MKQFNKSAVGACALILTLAFVAACGPSSYKSQRNLNVSIGDDHAANLATAEQIVAQAGRDALATEIQAAFPDVTAEHLETFAIQTRVMELNGNKKAMVQSSIEYPDTALPANEIMDFVQAKLEAELAALK